MSSFRLTACPHNQLNMHTPVYNLYEIDSYLLIELPMPMCRDMVVQYIDAMSPKYIEDDVVSFLRESPMWLKVDRVDLDLSSGQHVYKLRLVDKFTGETDCLYISYIIQDDNPDKPYIYMNRKTSYLDDIYGIDDSDECDDLTCSCCKADRR